MPAVAASSSASSPSTCSVGGIQPVGEQREMQLALRAGEVMDLQTLDLLLDRGGVVSSVGTATSVRNFAGTPPRSSRAGNGVAPKPRVTARFTSATAASMAGTSAENAEQAEPCCAEALSVQHEQRNGEKDSGNNAAGADVAADAEPAAEAPGPGTRGRPKADRRLERAAPAGEQVIAGIAVALLLDARSRRHAACSPPGRPRGRRRVRCGSRRAPVPRWRCGRDCASGNPSRETRCRRRACRRPG